MHDNRTSEAVTDNGARHLTREALILANRPTGDEIGSTDLYAWSVRAAHPSLNAGKGGRK